MKEIICSHGRSHELFTASINNTLNNACNLRGKQWDRSYGNVQSLVLTDCQGDCPEMGINSIQSYPQSTGTYFVATSDESPYCGRFNCHYLELLNVFIISSKCLIIFVLDVSDADRRKILIQLKEDKKSEFKLFSKNSFVG